MFITILQAAILDPEVAKATGKRSIESVLKYDHPLMTGLCNYDKTTMQEMMRDVEEQYKAEYKRPKTIPINERMVRQFPKNECETDSEREHKRVQAEVSRTSRDRYRFMRARINEDNVTLLQELNRSIIRLVNLEHYINDVLGKTGEDPIDWDKAWVHNDHPCAVNGIKTEVKTEYDTRHSAVEGIKAEVEPEDYSRSCAVERIKTKVEPEDDSASKSMIYEYMEETLGECYEMSIYESEDGGAHSGQEDA